MSQVVKKPYESKHFHRTDDAIDLGEIHATTKVKVKIDTGQIDSDVAAKRKLLQTFKCHICGKAADIPTISFELVDKKNFKGYEPKINYNNPADLWPCYICGQWTCDEHLHGVICKKCIEEFSNKEKL